MKLGRVSNFNQSINRHHHIKDHVETGHLTKYDAFRVNREAINLETSLILRQCPLNFGMAND